MNEGKLLKPEQNTCREFTYIYVYIYVVVATTQLTSCPDSASLTEDVSEGLRDPMQQLHN